MTGQPEHMPSPWNLVVDEKTLEFSIEDENGVTIVEGVLDTPSCRADADLIVTWALTGAIAVFAIWVMFFAGGERRK